MVNLVFIVQFPRIDSMPIKDISTPVQHRVVNKILIVINTLLDTNPTSVINSRENMSCLLVRFL